MNFLVIDLLFSAKIFESVILVSRFFLNQAFSICITDRLILFTYTSSILFTMDHQNLLYQDARECITLESAVYLSQAILGSRFNRPLCIEVYLLLEMLYLLPWMLWDWIVGCVYGQWTQWTLWDQLVFSGPWNIMFVYLRREFILLIHCFALLWGLNGFDFLLIYLLHLFLGVDRGRVEHLWRGKHLLQLRSPVKWD